MSAPSPPRTFEKPHRTTVARLFNAVGRRLRRWGWERPLTVGGVLDSARRSTGLSDWGDETFVEPLGVLVQSLEAEARLAPLGRLLLRRTLCHFAANRLWLRHYVKAHPEVRDEPLPRPLVVVGLPRTGTTLLYNLLCQDETRRAPRLWEVLRPAPGPGRDRRLRQARLLVRALDRWGAPRLRSIHPLHADGPEECTSLLFNTFVCPACFLFGGVYGYLEWLRGRGRELLPWVYAEHRTMLQVLQHQGRRAPWVLKSPAHSFGLEALLHELPDACVIRTHRDMSQVVPSVCSLFAIMHGLYSDDVDCRRLGREVARLLGDFLTERARADPALDRARVIDLDYRALVADPVAAVREVYRHFGLDFDPATEPRMRDWLARNPADKHGKHRYDLEQFGLTPQDMERFFPGERGVETPR